MARYKSPSRVVQLNPEAGKAGLRNTDLQDNHGANVQAVTEPVVVSDVLPAPVIPAGVPDLGDSLCEADPLLRKIERVGILETELTAAQQQTEELRAQLETSQRAAAEREASLGAELADRQRELMALQNKHAEAQVELAAYRGNGQRNQERDLLELRRRCEQQHEALSTWQGFRAVSESWLAEGAAQLRGNLAALQEAQAERSQLQDELAESRQQAAAQIAALTQTVREAEQARQGSIAEIRATADRVARLSADLAASQGALAQAQSEIEELRAVEGKARAGAARFDEQMQQIASLLAKVANLKKQQYESEARNRIASEREGRPEAEARARAVVLGNLQKNMDRLGREDAGRRTTSDQAGSGAVQRAFVRQVDGADMVYPLNRRTSIGRTPDNDIQVESHSMSRHHAVVLSSPDQCIVEDLNSTNGVLVNGRRVTRQILQDGDTVTVGGAEFRYQQRS
ncbi:MAG: FHA domain-containing protein [Steroidobacteraceae bacterium]